MADQTTRTETDSFGPLEVPADKYYGAQTARSKMNFPIGGETLPTAARCAALGVIKEAALRNVNPEAMGKLDKDRAAAIVEAATVRCADGRFNDHFPAGLSGRRDQGHNPT